MFRDHVVIACVAFVGVVMASVYMLRMFIRSMHNRVGPAATSTDLRFGDVLVLAPLVAVIVALALYPQLPIEKGENDIDDAIGAAQIADGVPAEQAGHPEIQIIR